MFKFFAGVSAVAAAAIIGMSGLSSPAVSADDARSVPVITGDWVDDWGSERSINARMLPSGKAAGSFTSGQNGELHFYCDINAVYREGNVAYASGIITYDGEPSDPDQYSFLGWTFIIRVTDNGQGKNASADTTSLFFIEHPDWSTAEDALDPEIRQLIEDLTLDYNDSDLTVVSGNLRVHNR
jgi:hypothetical protein